MNQLQNLDYCNQTIVLKKDIEKSFVSLGEHLKNIRDGNLFSPQWTSFHEFIWELGLKDGTVSKLINIYDTLVLKFPIPEADLHSPKGWSSLAEALPLINSQEDAMHYVQLRNTLTAKDYRDTVRAKLRGVDVNTCEHPPEFSVTLVWCKKCGYKHQEFNE